MEHIIQHFGCTDSPVGVCSTFEANGEIKGDGYVIVDTFPTGEFGFSQAHTVIHTKKGDLRCHEAALFVYPPDSDGVSPLMDICLIDGTTTAQHQGSTGIYAGASGFIQETGTFTYTDITVFPPVGEGSLDYTGKITLVHD